MISRYREAISRVAVHVAQPLIRAGVRPNHLTLAALLLVAAGSLLIATGSLIWGAAIAGLGGVLDLFDGLVARETGRESAWGGYLDSFSDRYGDGFAFLAVAWYYDTTWIWAVAFLAFLGAAATSYARARVHEDTHPPDEVWDRLVGRADRLIGLLFPVGFQGMADAAGLGVQFLPWVLVALAALGHATALRRALVARRLLREGA